MPGGGKSRTFSRVMVGSFLMALSITAALLFFFNPAEHGFYPRCMLKVTTGLDCPGCGGLRAAHQLLHGNLGAAFRLNPLLVALIPVGALLAARHALQLFGRRESPRPSRSGRWVWVLAFVVVAFGVLRNFPWRSWLGA